MDIARIRQTDRLRLEPLGLRHAEDLWRLYADPAVAEWYGQWTHEMVQREVARIAAAWAADGIHKWMVYHRHTGALVGRGCYHNPAVAIPGAPARDAMCMSAGVFSAPAPECVRPFRVLPARPCRRDAAGWR